MDTVKGISPNFVGYNQANNKAMEDELTGKQMEVLAKMQFMREEHARRNKELK